MILLHEHALSLFEMYVNEIYYQLTWLLYCRLMIKYITHIYTFAICVAMQ